MDRRLFLARLVAASGGLAVAAVSRGAQAEVSQPLARPATPAPRASGAQVAQDDDDDYGRPPQPQPPQYGDDQGYPAPRPRSRYYYHRYGDYAPPPPPPGGYWRHREWCRWHPDRCGY